MFNWFEEAKEIRYISAHAAEEIAAQIYALVTLVEQEQHQCLSVYSILAALRTLELDLEEEM